MPVQRKVFRIEEHARARVMQAVANGARGVVPHQLPSSPAGDSVPQADRDAIDHARAQIAEAQAYCRELNVICAAVAQSRSEMAGVAGELLDGNQPARAGRELAAIVTGTERATQSILQSAEDIDQAAAMLAASLKNGHDQGLAQDIQDRVVKIFEACNFQDLTGQRVGHVLATLKLVEDHLARLLEIWRHIEQFRPVEIGNGVAADDRRFLNGPMLPGEAGHSSQDDIDVIFRCA